MVYLFTTDVLLQTGAIMMLLYMCDLSNKVAMLLIPAK